MSELPGLIVPIEARIDKLEKGFQKANRAQRRASGQMERRSQQSAERIGKSYDKMGNQAAGAFKRLALPALAAAVSVQTVRRVADMTKAVAQLGDEAKRAGVNTEVFQEWKYIAEQNRIGVDQMTDGLKELSLRADEFILTSKGPAAEAFARLGYSTDQLRDKLKNPSELLLEIIGRMGDLDEAARIRISDEIFGGSAGERFVELVGRGEGALRDTIKAAHDAGAVLDDELIAKADEIDRKFTALKSRSAAFFKAVAVGAAETSIKIATLGVELEDLFRSADQAEGLLGAGIADALDEDADAAKENARVISLVRAEYERLGDSVDDQASGMMQAAAQMRNLGYDDLANQIYDASQSMLDLSGKLEDGTISADDFEKQMADVTNEAQTALGEIAAIDRSTFAGVIGGLGGLITKLGEAAARARDLRKELPGAEVDGSTKGKNYEGSGANPGNAYGASAVLPQAVSTSLRPQLPSMDHSFGQPDPEKDSGGGGGGGRTQSDYEREIASIQQETEALRIEAQSIAEVAGARDTHGDAIEYARSRAELLAAAQRSGVAMTPELVAQIDQLAGEYTRAGVEAETAADKIAEVQNASRAGADSIASVFEGMATGALSAKDAIGRLILEVLKLSLKKRLLESAEGAGGSWLGKVFGIIGGGFASGGYTGDGPKLEPAGVVHKGEFVMSKAATSAIGADTLAGLHSAALRGYSGGGLVGAAKGINTRSGTRTGPQGDTEPTINISAPVTVTGSAGTPDQNQDLAKKTAKEMEMTMRGVVVDELRRQSRPGNMLNQGRY